MPASKISSLTALAQSLLEQCKALDAYAGVQGLPPVSFENESFVDLPHDMETKRKNAIDLAQDIKRLVQGPRDLLFEIGNLFGDLANFQYINHHGIAAHVPLEGDISYTELAAAAQQDEVFLRRMLRVAMMNRLFAETANGHVCHSAASRILRQEPASSDAMGFLLEEMFPAAAHLMQSRKQYPNSGQPNETAFNVAFNTVRPFYLELEAHPERAQRFGSAMRWMSQGGQFATERLINGYDWASLDSASTLIVDVGGGQGAVARAIVGATNDLRIIVQDLPVVASQGQANLPSEFHERIAFAAHDFFAEQPIIGADMYFLRYILHNWSDEYAIRILKALIPALRHGTRIMLYEFLPSDSSETRWSEKQNYNMDMISAIGWNSIERTTSDWARLFEAVDPRLQFLGARFPPGCFCALIEAQFVDETADGAADGAANGANEAVEKLFATTQRTK